MRGDGSASLNPLISNLDISNFIRTYKISLVEADYAATRKRPITVSQITHQAEQYCYGGTRVHNCTVLKKDVALHTAILVGVNISVRFDEQRKFTSIRENLK